MQGLLVEHKFPASCVLVAGRAHISTGTVQNLAERFLKRVEAVTAAKREELSINAHGFGMGCSGTSEVQLPCLICKRHMEN